MIRGTKRPMLEGEIDIPLKDMSIPELQAVVAEAKRIISLREWEQSMQSLVRAHLRKATVQRR